MERRGIGGDRLQYSPGRGLVRSAWSSMLVRMVRAEHLMWIESVIDSASSFTKQRPGRRDRQ